MSDVWVVQVSIDDEDAEQFGPYTERQAKRVAARIEKEAQDGTDEFGGVHHPHSVTLALPWPLTRYDRFLTTEQKREMRADVREANKREFEE